MSKGIVSSFLIVIPLATGCGDEMPSSEEPLAEEQQTIVTGHEFSKDAPTVIVQSQGPQHEVAMRVGNGQDADYIITYLRQPNVGDPHRPWLVTYPAVGNPAAPRTLQRPLRFWNGRVDKFSTIFTDITGIVRDTAVPPGPDVYPDFFGDNPNEDAVGGPSGIALASDGLLDSGIFTRMTNDTIQQSYDPASPWSDFPLVGLAATPRSGALAIQRSFTPGASTNSDSVWFACGPASPATACEFRRRVSPQGALSFSTTFGGASSAIVANTRPTAIADLGLSFGGGTGARWVFASIIESGTQTIAAKRETSAIGSSSAPTYTATVIDSTPTAVGSYSTPMPYIRGDGRLAVVYYKTNPSRTEVWEALWSDLSVWVKEKIYEFDVIVAAPNHPVPFVSRPLGVDLPFQDVVLMRAPLPGNPAQVRDTIELRRQANFKWMKQLLPMHYENSNLYVMWGSSLYQTNEDNPNVDRTALPNAVWSGSTAFTSDGVGLGYVIQGGALWEVNLNDGSRRQLGVENWTGTTQLVFGYDASNRQQPRLWAIRNGELRKIDIPDGSSQHLTGTNWTGASTMGYLAASSGALDLYIVNGNDTLYAVNSNTGAPTQRGSVGAWPMASAMTSASDGQLYICDGSSSTSTRVYRVNPSTGALSAWTGLFSNCQGLANVKGSAYLMKSRKIYKVVHSGGSTLSLTSTGTQSWDYTVTGMVGRNL